MITFKQFISEDAKSFQELIEKNCADFLSKSAKQGFLYRGIKGLASAEAHEVEGIEYAIKAVRKDRKPLDTNKHLHTSIGEWFKTEFGWNPRSEGVFAFGEGADLSDIRAYGEPCIIFPIGEIHYVWSKTVEDLFSDISIEFINSDEELERWLDDANYEGEELAEAVQRGNEIMVKCDKYYAFPIAYKAHLKEILGFS